MPSVHMGALASLFLLYGLPNSAISHLDVDDVRPTGLDGPQLRARRRGGRHELVALAGPAAEALTAQARAAGDHGPMFSALTRDGRATGVANATRCPWRSHGPPSPRSAMTRHSAPRASSLRRGSLGGFNWSSQHSIGRSCDGRRVQAWERAGRPVMRSPGRPPVGRLEHRQRFWAAIARGVSSEAAAAEAGVSGPVGVRWFREGGGMPTVTLAAPSGTVPVVRRARGNRPAACCWLRGAGGRAPARSVAVDDLAGAATQRRDPQRAPRVSRDDRAVACRPAGAAAQAGQARRQRRAAALCPSPAGWRGPRTRWCRGGRPGRQVDRPAPRSPQGSPLGPLVESRADLSPATPGLPR